MFIAARKRILGGGWKNPYNGADVAMFDAIWNDGGGKTNPSALVWTDCINGIVAIPDNFKQSEDYEFSFGTDYCKMRHCNLGVSSNLIDTAVNSAGLTVEFMLAWEGSTSRFYLLSNAGNNSQGSWLNQGYSFKAVKGANDVRTDIASLTFYVGTKVHIAMVFDNGSRSFWVNGVNTKNESGITESPSPAIGMLFGSQYLYADFTTCVDANFVRITSRALTAQEIAANYAVDAARFNLPTA